MGQMEHRSYQSWDEHRKELSTNGSYPSIQLYPILRKKKTLIQSFMQNNNNFENGFESNTAFHSFKGINELSEMHFIYIAHYIT